jgi:hypothetical protein
MVNEILSTSFLFTWNLASFTKENAMKVIPLVIVSLTLIGCAAGRIPLDRQGMPNICGCPHY